MTYAEEAEEREERRALKRELFADDLLTLAALATKFTEHYTMVFDQASPQDRERLASIVNRIDTDIIAVELQAWADGSKLQQVAS